VVLVLLIVLSDLTGMMLSRNILSKRLNNNLSKITSKKFTEIPVKTLSNLNKENLSKLTMTKLMQEK